MTHSVQYIAEDHYFLITLEGEIESKSIKSLIKETDQFINEYNCNRILGDFRKAELNLSAIAIMDLYEFWIDTLMINNVSKFNARRVILLQKDQATTKNYRFFETISLNRNSKVKIFFDIHEAVSWLVSA